MTLRGRLLLVGAGTAASLAVAPLLQAPQLALALVTAAVVAWLAARSVAYPLALAAVPSIVIALLGSNPFPERSVAVFTFGWTALAVGLVVLREDDALPFRALFSGAVLGSTLLAAWMLVRLAGSPAEAYGSLKLQLFVTGNVLVLLAGYVLARRRREFELWVVLSLVVSAAGALVLVWNVATGQAQEVFDSRFALDPASNPIQLGRGAAQGVLIAIYLVLAARLASVRLLALAALPPLAVALIASGSRGPVLGLIVGAVLLLALQSGDREQRRRLALVVGAAVGAGVLVARLLPPDTTGRALSVLVGGGTDSSNGRYDLWSSAWEVFAERPLVGIGTGGFADLGAELYPHNLPLEVAAELGLVGLVLLGVALGPAVARIVAGRRHADPFDRGRLALVVALLAAALVNSLFSGDIQTNQDVWLAVGLGLGVLEVRPAGGGFGRLVRRRRAAADPGESAPGGAPPRPPERSGGRIVSPEPDDVVAGRVVVRALPAQTGWGAVSLIVEAAGTDGAWQEVARAEDESVDLVAVEQGADEHVATVRSRRLAELLRESLSPLVGAIDVLPSSRRPWSTGAPRIAVWDTTGLRTGRWALRAVTVDVSGFRIPSDPVPVTVAGATEPIAEPGQPLPEWLEEQRGLSVRERLEAVRRRAAVPPEDLLARERQLESARRELEIRRRVFEVARDAELARPALLAEREARLEERVAMVTRRELELTRRAASLAERERELAASLGREQELVEVQAQLAGESAADVAQARRELDEAEERWAEEEERLVTLRRELARERERAATQRDEQDRREAELDELLAQAAAADAELATRTARLESAHAELAERERDTDEQRALAEAEEERLQAVAAALEQDRRAQDERARALAAARTELGGARRELEARTAALDQRARALADSERDLARREQELSRQVELLEERRAVVDEADERRQRVEQELGERRAELAELESGLTAGRARLEELAAELERVTGELAEQEARLASARSHREPAPVGEVPVVAEPGPAPEPEAQPAPSVPLPPPPAPEPRPEAIAMPPAPAEPGALTLWQLERLVAENPSDDVYVQSDREATLFLLRDYVGVDGRIPPQFDVLVHESFGGLIEP